MDGVAEYPLGWDAHLRSLRGWTPSSAIWWRAVLDIALREFIAHLGSGVVVDHVGPWRARSMWLRDASQEDSTEDGGCVPGRTRIGLNCRHPVFRIRKQHTGHGIPPQA